MAVSRSYGTASPAPDGNRLLFADYSASGYAVASVSRAELFSPETEPVGGQHVDYFAGLEAQEADIRVLTETAIETGTVKTDFIIENYYPSLGLFNFHSRGIGTSSNGSGITINLQADGIMNDSSGRLYAGYDPDNSEFMTGLSGAWAGFFPVFLYGAEIQTPAEAFGALVQSDIYGGIWLPLDFSEGIYNNTLGAQVILLMQNSIYPYPDTKTAIQTGISWRFTQNSAKRDLIPPAGFMFSADWFRNITPSWYNCSYSETAFYLPGLLQNHGIEIDIHTNYNFESSVQNKASQRVPRGYSSNDYEVPLLFGASINYIMPLAYPDFNIGGFIYISRLSLNCFLDTTALYNDADKLFSETPDGILQSTGIELFTDFHLFNSYVPLRAGLRFIYDTINGGIRIEDTLLSIGIDIL
jgi:hypothetical protein